MSVFIRWCILLSYLVISTSLLSAGGLPQNPIMFVTVVPMCEDSATQCSVLSSHLAGYNNVLLGGDLYIRYPDGTLKNLTRAAGFGSSMLQDANAISVRQPCVHWSAKKAVFSMVCGAVLSNRDKREFYWQLFEVTGLAKDETPVITKVQHQPIANNISPIYGTDDRIIFISDKPLLGDSNIAYYRDESIGMPCVSGIWSLHPQSGEIVQLTHSPSGVSNLSMDSYGRVLFSQWDFLQQDMSKTNSPLGLRIEGHDEMDGFTEFPQAFFLTKLNSDTTRVVVGGYFGDSVRITNSLTRQIATNSEGVDPHLPANFFPWEIDERGRGMQTLNHIGRHDLLDTIPANDSQLTNFSARLSNRKNKNSIVNVLQLREDPRNQGCYVAVDAPNGMTHGAGQLIRLTHCGLNDASRDVEVQYLTPRSTRTVVPDKVSVPTDHSGLYRNPLLTNDRLLIASHTLNYKADVRTKRPSADSRFHFRLRVLRDNGSFYEPSEYLTTGIPCTISYVDAQSPYNDIIDVNQVFWEMDPVEVVAQQKPSFQNNGIADLERAVFESEGVPVDVFQNFMRKYNLALVVSRDLRQRDPADKQQPFILKTVLSDDSAQDKGSYRLITHFDVFEAAATRWYTTAGGSLLPGRRCMAAPIFSSPYRGDKDVQAHRKTLPSSVRIEEDGSAALLVPAGRALSWQTSSSFQQVVCERFWVTLAAGEIRTCARCHGENERASILSQPMPSNEAKALRGLLHQWKSAECTGTVQPIAPLTNAIPQGYPLWLSWRGQPNVTSYDVTIRCASCDDKRIVLHRTVDASRTALFVTANDMDTSIKDFEWQVAATSQYRCSDTVITSYFTTRKPDIVNDVDLSSIQDFLINPQPAHDALRIRGSLLQPDNITIVLRNVLGAEIKKTEILTQGLIFDANIFVQDVPSGIYQVCMVTTTGERRRPIVITH